LLNKVIQFRDQEIIPGFSVFSALLHKAELGFEIGERRNALLQGVGDNDAAVVSLVIGEKLGLLYKVGGVGHSTIPRLKLTSATTSGMKCLMISHTVSTR